ncbi:hypothetical protein AHF37_12468 [Paragonimus kellicotti]|nr:hypothetical protein AHF37_12468 [Paragonimus kellicotti]
MRSSPCDLSVIWDRSRSDPLDIPAFPNGLWPGGSSPWSSPSASPGRVSGRSESDATMAPLLCERMGKLSLQSGQPRAVGSHLSRVGSCGRTEDAPLTFRVRKPNTPIQTPLLGLNDSTRHPPNAVRTSHWSTFENELEIWERRFAKLRTGGQNIPQQHLLAFTEFLRRFRTVVRRKKEEGLDLCAFCRNNGEPFAVYITHKVRDANGRVTCPVLRLLSCPLCKSTGDLAHTIKYCPYKKHLPP